MGGCVGGFAWGGDWYGGDDMLIEYGRAAAGPGLEFETASAATTPAADAGECGRYG